MSPTKIQWYVASLLCVGMLVPGWIVYWITSVPTTYKIGTFVGVVYVVVFAACGIYHRRKLNEIQRA